jgi:TPP-dependent pyruvate/acetoin dehydrogenase alpha subunit
MPGLCVDAQDVIAVRAASTAAVNRARSGGGPSLMECKTYRYYGHHQGDDTRRYRTKEEEDAARERDCIKRLQEHVLNDGSLRPEELDAIERNNTEKLNQAISFAEQSPLPPPCELYTDVW